MVTTSAELSEPVSCPDVGAMGVAPRVGAAPPATAPVEKAAICNTHAPLTPSLTLLPPTWSPTIFPSVVLFLTVKLPPVVLKLPVVVPPATSRSPALLGVALPLFAGLPLPTAPETTSRTEVVLRPLYSKMKTSGKVTLLVLKVTVTVFAPALILGAYQIFWETCDPVPIFTVLVPMASE